MFPKTLKLKARLRRSALVLLTAVALMSVLAACGDDEDSTSLTSPAEDNTSVTSPDEGPVALGQRVRDLTGFDLDPDACGGQEIPIGAVLAFTGAGSFYGSTMSRGLDLAAAHIEAAGGPIFEIDYHDHKSGDPAAGVQAMTELGEGGYVAKLASYVDDLGAMLPQTAEYEMFTLDGGGGTSVFGQGQPFFWGTRAITPNDPLPGLFQYLKQTEPDLSTVGVVVWDIGEPGNGIIRDDMLDKIADAGYEFNGLYELTPVGAQDYSQVLPKITANEPDILLAAIYGQDIGSFVNQIDTAGVESTLIGFEFTPDGINASKGTFENGYTFAYDYFDAVNPTNPWAELFVDEFEAEYDELPDFYAANYYEDLFGMWDLVRRVCQNGDEVTGAALNAAFRENPSYASLYGGDASGPGIKTIDLETHSVLARTMGVFTYEDGGVVPHAYFDLNGDDVQMAQ